MSTGRACLATFGRTITGGSSGWGGQGGGSTTVWGVRCRAAPVAASSRGMSIRTRERRIRKRREQQERETSLLGVLKWERRRKEAFSTEWLWKAPSRHVENGQAEEAMKMDLVQQMMKGDSDDAYDRRDGREARARRSQGQLHEVAKDDNDRATSAAAVAKDYVDDPIFSMMLGQRSADEGQTVHRYTGVVGKGMNSTAAPLGDNGNNTSMGEVGKRRQRGHMRKRFTPEVYMTKRWVDEAAPEVVEEPDADEVEVESPEGSRSGTVAVLGLPNAGKTTLTNLLVGGMVGAVSKLRHTTRKSSVGIATLDNLKTQLALVDTPGIGTLRPNANAAENKTSTELAKRAWRALHDGEVDVAMLVVDATADMDHNTKALVDGVASAKCPIVVVFNKIDLLANRPRLKKRAAQVEARIHAALPSVHKTLHVSALRASKIDELKTELAALSPLAPWRYPPEWTCEQSILQRVEEAIREQVYRHCYQELPYQVMQRNVGWADTGSDTEEGLVQIDQQLLIPKKGMLTILSPRRLNKIAAAAQPVVRRILDRRNVNIHLSVKLDETIKDYNGVY